MFEHVVQMGPMLVVAALLVGWMTEAVSGVGGYGLLHDMGLGLVGSVLVGGTVWVVVSGEAGMLAMFLIGCGGATLAIVAQRRLWRSARLAT
jgi:hypothetical protein